MRLSLIIAASIFVAGCASYWTNPPCEQADLDNESARRSSESAVSDKEYGFGVGEFAEHGDSVWHGSTCLDKNDTTCKTFVAVGYFIGGLELPWTSYFLEPDGTEIPLEGGPPVALRFKVTRSLFGPPLPTQLDAIKLGSDGLDRITFGYEHHYIILLEWNGDEFRAVIMEPLGWTDRRRSETGYPDKLQNLAVPVLDEEGSIFWLPCSVSENPEAMNFWGPDEAVQLFIWDTDLLEDLKEVPDLVDIDGQIARIKKGIYLEEVERRLQGMSQAEINAGCH